MQFILTSEHDKKNSNVVVAIESLSVHFQPHYIPYSTWAGLYQIFSKRSY